MPQAWYKLDEPTKKVLKKACALYDGKKIPITKKGHGETRAMLSCYGNLDKNDFNIHVNHVFHKYDTKKDSGYGDITIKNEYGKNDIIHLTFSGMDDNEFDKILDSFDIPLQKFKRTNPN